MDSIEEKTLEVVARFGPLKKEDITELVPNFAPYEVDSAIKSLKENDVLKLQGENNIGDDGVIFDDDVIMVNTKDYEKALGDNQKTLAGNEVKREDVIEKVVPGDIETSDEITLKLSREESLLFMKMWSNVSQDCGNMTQEEFVRWLIREARRMTEV